MVIETVFSMLTLIGRFKHQSHRAGAYFNAHLSFAVATFNLLVQWHGLAGMKTDSSSCLSEFSL